ncbi:MAG: hypothetical protein CMB80_02795 [Flammeovirgaceae bacterium]|nr:hypothetical protein [Flammeovirgaceae bacterium]
MQQPDTFRHTTKDTLVPATATKPIVEGKFVDNEFHLTTNSYRHEIHVKEVFGRMHFYNMGMIVYHTEDSLFNLWRANSYKFGTKVHVEPPKVEYEFVDEPITEDIIDKMVHTNVTDRIRTAVNNTSIDSSLMDGIPDGVAQAIIDDLKSSVQKHTSTYKKRVKKEKTTLVPKTSLRLTATYDFNGFTLYFEDDEEVKLLKKLQPEFDKARAIVESIQDWRKNGLPDESKDYVCKGEFQPFDHQWVMYAVHMLLDKSANLSQMGTGKTFSVLMAIDKRIQLKQVRKGKILIVCPTTVMPNWIKEIKRHTPHLSGKILEGSFKKRSDAFFSLSDEAEAEDDILIINYEAFTMKVKEEIMGKSVEVPLAKLMKFSGWDMVVLDECHKIKNPEAQRTGALIDAFSESPYKIIMSGTINANKLHDVHMPFVFLNRAAQWNSKQRHRSKNDKGEHEPYTFGELHGDFKDAYFVRGGWNWHPRQGTVQNLRERFEEVGVRYEKEECFTLPEKMYDMRELQMTPKQEEVYKALETKFITQLSDIADSGGSVTILNILAMMVKLAEVANGWIYDDSGRAITLPWNPKLDALCEIIDDIDIESSKIVIWSRFTNDLHIIADKLKKDYGNEKIAVIHGGDHCSCGSSKKNRYDVVNKFLDKDSDPRIIVINQAVGSHGIDLTSASYEIFYSNSFVKTDRVQSEDRCHRIGMQDSLTIYDLVMKNTVDESVMMALKSHKGMTIALLEGLGVDAGSYVNEQPDEPAIVEHQRQGSKECHLASLCMIAGKTIEEGRTVVNKLFGTSDWKEVNTWENADKLCKHWNIERVPLPDVPKKGKGLIYTRGTTTGHVVVYTDGKIFDPALPGPKPTHVWMRDVVENGLQIVSIYSV